MLFRNITFFEYPEAVNLAGLEEGADAHKLKPVGPLEVASTGFIAPVADDERLIVREGDFIYLAIGTETKVLPATAINHLLQKHLAEIERREGRKPSGRARKRIKEELIHELLPKALVKPGQLDVVIDTLRRTVAVSTASPKPAEAAVGLIRRALGSFPATQLSPQVSPVAVMTEWVDGNSLPCGFVLTDECELRDSVDSYSVVRATLVNLRSAEIAQHLDAGWCVTRLRLNLADQIEATLDDALRARSVVVAFADDDLDSVESVAAARLLHASAYRDLYDALALAFSLVREIGP